MDRADYMDDARAFLREVRLIDGHNDLPYVIWAQARKRRSSGAISVPAWNPRVLHAETDTDIPRLIEGQVATQIFTAFLPTYTPNPMRARLDLIDIMLQLEQEYVDVFHPVLAPADITAARAGGKIGLLKAVEGLTGVESLADIRLFHAMGIRLITLCHNETLPFVDSATDVPGVTPLSEFGAEIIHEMERLGLLIDLAHVSPAAQQAVLDVAKGPVLISHANARALCGHPRNAPDDVMRRIADGGGIIMATFVPAFLSQACYEALLPAYDGMGKAPTGQDPAVYQTAKTRAFATFAGHDGVACLADHLDYMRNLIGEDALGIGSDFYGGPNPPGLEDASTFPAVFAELMARGWKHTALAKLAGGNFERVWGKVWRG
jgi:membrane dipeptidase